MSYWIEMKMTVQYTTSSICCRWSGWSCCCRTPSPWAQWPLLRLATAGAATWSWGSPAMQSSRLVSILVGDLRSYGVFYNCRLKGEASGHFFWLISGPTSLRTLFIYFLYFLKGTLCDLRFFQQSSSRNPRKLTNAVSILMVLMKIISYL